MQFLLHLLPALIHIALLPSQLVPPETQCNETYFQPGKLVHLESNLLASYKRRHPCNSLAGELLGSDDASKTREMIALPNYFPRLGLRGKWPHCCAQLTGTAKTVDVVFVFNFLDITVAARTKHLISKESSISQC